MTDGQGAGCGEGCDEATASKNNCICVCTPKPPPDMLYVSVPDSERSLQLEKVRLFVLIVTLSVLANASKIWCGGFNSA